MWHRIQSKDTDDYKARTLTKKFVQDKKNGMQKSAEGWAWYKNKGTQTLYNGYIQVSYKKVSNLVSKVLR